ncbi:helix-turn-helix domain-containing protein [Nonomuraea sp. NPDC049709]|uniref:helix-turn-helix domain-containing protein n=1 Tax=Nonomuraea sp. NPDC049709 TaxID=3154736 RepID=UPI00343726F1
MDLVQLRYSFRIDPAPRQRMALAKAFGCARVVFNDALALRTHTHEHVLPPITDACPAR